MRRILCCLLAVLASRDAARAADGLEFFEKKIRPVLIEQCYSCHSVKEKKSRGGLFLDSRAAMLKGGDTGPAIDLSKPEKSLLLQVLRYDGELKMPPKAKLSASAIADFEAWIKMGAPAPEGKPLEKVVGIDWNEARRFWSFQPVRRPDLPAVKTPAWASNPIDRFILARLESERITPVETADRRTLIRRLSFDLLGLPPTPEEVDAFLADKHPDAYNRLVERFLASPAFGERWARYWLDVARYAEDQAHTFGVKPNTSAWRYRDWVVGAFNSDLPYDRFVKLQFAADQLPDSSLADKAALGFFGLGAQYYKNTDAARATADELDDRVDTLARGFLGLTVSCARCHDHKYDPVPTLDYYSLAGVFHSSKLSDVTLASREEIDRHQAAMKKIQEAERVYRETFRTEKVQLAREKLARFGDYLLVARDLLQNKGDPAARAKQDSLDPAILKRFVSLLTPDSKQGRNLPALDVWRKAGKDTPGLPEAASKLQKQLIDLVGKDEKALKRDDKALVQFFLGDAGMFALPDNAVMKALPPERRERMERLKTQADTLKRDQPPALPVAHGLADGNVNDHKVFIRGNPATPGPAAPRRFLRILAGDEPAKFTKGSGRAELAEAITDVRNPLTARVMVNRLWTHHFGKGIVGTPSNFGKLGEAPTHPELLDFLATELISSGWSLKHIHRLIVTSSTYRLASNGHSENQVKDPDNRFYWRMNRRRLDVESWRDALLATSGQLERNFGGPTLDLGSDNNRRRTVYARISRHELNGFLRLFDFPDANITSEKRTETTVPQQQLFVLNSPFMLARAKGLAARMESEADGPSPEARVRRAYEVTFGRPATEAEVRVLTGYLTASDDNEEKSKNQLSRAERLAQVLLASNEFLYID